MQVKDPSGILMMSGDSMTRGVVEQPAWGIMQTQGAAIDVDQVKTKVQGLLGEHKSSNPITFSQSLICHHTMHRLSRMVVCKLNLFHSECRFCCSNFFRTSTGTGMIV